MFVLSMDAASTEEKNSHLEAQCVNYYFINILPSIVYNRDRAINAWFTSLKDLKFLHPTMWWNVRMIIRYFSTEVETIILTIKI